MVAFKKFRQFFCNFRCSVMVADVAYKNHTFFDDHRTRLLPQTKKTTHCNVFFTSGVTISKVLKKLKCTNQEHILEGHRFFMSSIGGRNDQFCHQHLCPLFSFSVLFPIAPLSSLFVLSSSLSSLVSSLSLSLSLSLARCLLPLSVQNWSLLFVCFGCVGSCALWAFGVCVCVGGGCGCGRGSGVFVLVLLSSHLAVGPLRDAWSVASCWSASPCVPSKTPTCSNKRADVLKAHTGAF